MSSEDLFLSDEFEQHYDSIAFTTQVEDDAQCDMEIKFRSLNIDKLSNLIDYFIISEEGTPYGTSLCFQMFYNAMSNSIHARKLDGDYSDLQVIQKNIERLKRAGKFDSFAFVDYLFNEFLIIPLEVIWWLHKLDILMFMQYCTEKQPTDIADQLIKIMRKCQDDALFPSQQITEDLLEEIISGCYSPIFYRLNGSKIWSNFCGAILDDLIEKSFEPVFSSTSEPLVANFFPFVRNMNGLPSAIFKRLYIRMLTKLFASNVEEYDMYGAYTYQEIWTSTRIPKNVRTIYEEIFTKYCDINTVFKIIDEELEYEINWKFVLMAVGVCVQSSKSGSTQLQEVTIKYLNAAFKGGHFEEFMKALLLIRQGCMEKNMNLDYKTWFTNTFGINTTYKTSLYVSIFKYFLTCLTTLIPYESKTYLKNHIDRAIRPPPKCNSFIFDYKTLCRARLEELRHSPVVTVNEVEITVLHLIEDCQRNECVSSMMIHILKRQYSDFLNVIVPQIQREKQPFVKVRNILMEARYLTDEILENSRTDLDNMLFDDEDDDIVFR